MKQALVFGAAALGNQYGQFGEPLIREGRETERTILDSVRRNGFGAVDTAPAYGESEAVIGASSWSGEIHTKLRNPLDPQESVRNSLQVLQRDKLDLLYLFHEPSAWLAKSESDQLRVLNSVQPYVEKLGASVYTVEETEKLMDAGWPNVIQIPGNLWNRELLTFFRGFRGSRPKVYVRSVFLQSLILRPELPKRFGQLRPFVADLTRLSAELGRSRMELAIGWILAHDCVDGIILGAQATKEVDEISSTLRNLRLSEKEIYEIDALPQPPRTLVDPRNWK